MRILAEASKFRDGEDLKTKLRVYWPLLSDLSPTVLETAFQQLAKESIWFPTVAEIRECCKRVSQRLIAQKEQKRLDWAKAEAVKAERFLGTPDPVAAVEARRREFRQMLREAGMGATADAMDAQDGYRAREPGEDDA